MHESRLKHEVTESAGATAATSESGGREDPPKDSPLLSVRAGCGRRRPLFVVLVGLTDMLRMGVTLLRGLEDVAP